MKAFWKALIHAAVGGAVAGLATIPAGAPVTARSFLFPALASALTSVISLFAQSPLGGA